MTPTAERLEIMTAIGRAGKAAAAGMQGLASAFAAMAESFRSVLPVIAEAARVWDESITDPEERKRIGLP